MINMKYRDWRSSVMIRYLISRSVLGSVLSDVQFQVTIKPLHVDRCWFTAGAIRKSESAERRNVVKFVCRFQVWIEVAEGEARGGLNGGCGIEFQNWLNFYFQTPSDSIFLRESRKKTCLKSHYNPPRAEHVPCGPPAQMIAPNGDDEVNIQLLQTKYLRVQTKNYKKATEKFFFGVFSLVRLFTVLMAKLFWSESVKIRFELRCLYAWMNSR